MSKSIPGVLILADNTGQTETRFLRYTLDYTDYRDFYPLLGIETFDIQTRPLGNAEYDIYCDDEGLLKENPVPTFVTLSGGKITEIIVGSIFLCGHDEDGGIRGLTEHEINCILSHKGALFYQGRVLPVLVSGGTSDEDGTNGPLFAASDTDSR